MSTSSTTQRLIDLEIGFWRSLVNQDAETAVRLLAEPALMVSSHGAMKFDHAGYRKMATQGSMVVTSFELSEIEVLLPNESTGILTYRVKQVVAPRDSGQSITQDMWDSSTWIQTGRAWRCVMHTETAATASA